MVIKVYWNCFVNIMSECLGHKVHVPADVRKGIELELRVQMEDFKFKFYDESDKELLLEIKKNQYAICECIPT